MIRQTKNESRKEERRAEERSGEQRRNLEMIRETRRESERSDKEEKLFREGSFKNTASNKRLLRRGCCFEDAALRRRAGKKAASKGRLNLSEIIYIYIYTKIHIYV